MVQRHGAALGVLGSTGSTRRASYQHSSPFLCPLCFGLQSQAEQPAPLCRLPRLLDKVLWQRAHRKGIFPLCLASRLREEGSFGQSPAAPAIALTRNPTDKCPHVKLVGFLVCKPPLQWKGHRQPLSVQVLTWEPMLRTGNLCCAGAPHVPLCGVLLCTGLLQALFCLYSPAQASGFSMRHAESFVCSKAWISSTNASWTRRSL